ncbi:MAG: nitroreductase [Rubrivivax sp.]
MTPDPTPAYTEAVEHAIQSRRSVRAFLPTPVPRALVERILRVASRAPSGTNTQPWRVHVLMGEARQRVSARILAAFNDPQQLEQHQEDYAYYPLKWVSPYIERRRKIGWDMYGLLGIGREDKQRMHEQLGRNFLFFDAPVGLFFVVDRIIERGGWFDYGMFVENVMVAARAHGLHTCPQQAFARFHRVVAAELGWPETQMLICGMAMGYEDTSAPVNQLVTERVPVAEFAQFHER